MPIAFSCPHCGVKTNVGDQFAGQSGPCAQCGGLITVPMPAEMHGLPQPGGSSQPSSGGGSVVVILLIVGGCVLLLLLACGGIALLGLRAPIQIARSAAVRAQAANNLSQIMLAMHNYHEVYRSFPPAYTVDADGNKLHSWRTLILPYVDQQALYDQIDRQEPWDSPKNLPLTNTIVAVFNYNAPSPFTDYVVITSPGTIFEDSTPVGMVQILDGTANTLAVVEIPNSEISRMEPRDISIDEFIQLATAGAPPGRPPQGFHAATADGAVRLLPYGQPANLLKSYTTRAGGEVAAIP